MKNLRFHANEIQVNRQIKPTVLNLNKLQVI